METVAVYFEEIIRTYGFDVRRDLTLARLTQPDEIDAETDLIMATAGRSGDGSLALWVVVAGEAAQALRSRAAADPPLEIVHPVDVVHFHGPHFGDRYGIVKAAQSALRHVGVRPLLVSCTGASVYLAVEGGQGAQTVQGLKKAFSAPVAKSTARRQRP